MKGNRFPIPKYPNHLNTESTGTTADPPPISSTSTIPSMFNSARNTLITGGSFNIASNSTVVTGQPLNAIVKRVAPNAILNAGGRADEVRCHPGTREGIIGCIERWGNAQGSATPPIFWLSGPAGAGKSAIMQTIAERCDQRRTPHANFFFFRADSTRSNAFPLIATLVYQLISFYPPLQNVIANLLSVDPLVLDSTLEKQLFQLIVVPLRAIKCSFSDTRPLVLLIDGLDECDSTIKRDQERILQAFDKVLAEPSCPFRVLIASRDESQIRAAFNSVKSRRAQLFLNDQYISECDIRFFVRAQFEKIKRTHPLAYTLGAAWPLVEDVDYIVEKSSGQFLYSATVMRFISNSAASPLVSLERVKGAMKLATKSPFSHLDAMYAYILSQADDQEALKDILHAACAMQSSISSTKMSILDLLTLVNQRYSHVMIFSCLADITPIARYDRNTQQLLFYHASFFDYLQDPSRAKDHFVDLSQFYYVTLPAIWRYSNNGSCSMDWVRFGLHGMTKLKKLPPHLMSLVAMTKFGEGSGYDLQSTCIFKIIYRLCNSDDDIKHFRRFFFKWIESRHENIFQRIKDLPFGQRYYYMIQVNPYIPPNNEMLAALQPETDFDRHELSLWLRDSVFLRYGKTWPNHTTGYKELVKFWLRWAFENDIPTDVFKGVPYAEEYVQWNKNQKWAKL